jgi:uncharacterized membrane protein
MQSAVNLWPLHGVAVIVANFLLRANPVLLVVIAACGVTGAAAAMPVMQILESLGAATDNVGLFFGEDIFVAFGAIVLMQTILRAEGIEVDPLHMALCGIPTAVCAFIIHAWNLRRLDAQSRREGEGA